MYMHMYIFGCFYFYEICIILNTSCFNLLLLLKKSLWIQRTTKTKALKVPEFTSSKEHTKAITTYGTITTGKELITDWTGPPQQGIKGPHGDS